MFATSPTEAVLQLQAASRAVLEARVRVQRAVGHRNELELVAATVELKQRQAAYTAALARLRLTMTPHAAPAFSA